MNEGRFPQEGDIPFSFVFRDFTSTCGEQPFRACSHDPGTAHCLGATHCPGVNFASVHGLMSVTVQMNFLLAVGQLRDPLYNTR